MTTVQERLERAHDALTLIVAACNSGDGNPFDQEDVIAAISRAALAAREDVYWVKQVPKICPLPAPSIDETATPVTAEP